MTKGQDCAPDVAARWFTDDRAARKWNDLYNSESEVLEEQNYRERRDVAVSLVERLLPPQGRVLDLGCGSAPVLGELRRRGIHCTGLDFSEDMLRHARERLLAQGVSDGDLHQGDCQRTPFEDAAFDVVLCLGVISYVEDRGAVLREVRRLLKPGGHAVVSFRNKFNPVVLDPVIAAKQIAKAIMRWGPHAQAFRLGAFLDHREVQKELGELGFRYRDFIGIGLGPVRFHCREVFSQRTTLRLSGALTRAFGRLGWRWPFVWAADVSIWVYQKDRAA